MRSYRIDLLATGDDVEGTLYQALDQYTDDYEVVAYDVPDDQRVRMDVVITFCDDAPESLSTFYDKLETWCAKIDILTEDEL